LNFTFDLAFESLEFPQGFLGKVFGRWCVFLHALEVLDSVLGLDFLLVDDVLQLLVLPVDFLEYFFFEAFLPHDSALHVCTSREGFATLREDGFKLSDLA